MEVWIDLNPLDCEPKPKAQPPTKPTPKAHILPLAPQPHLIKKN